jgi:hypothetical protein
MKYVNVFVLTLLLSVVATSAHAGAGKVSLFRCGLQLGGTTVDYKTDTGSRKNKGYATNTRASTARSNGPRVTNFTTALAKDNGRLRMPPALTLAKFACSWR